MSPSASSIAPTASAHSADRRTDHVAGCGRRRRPSPSEFSGGGRTPRNDPALCVERRTGRAGGSSLWRSTRTARHRHAGRRAVTSPGRPAGIAGQHGGFSRPTVPQESPLLGGPVATRVRSRSPGLEMGQRQRISRRRPHLVEHYALRLAVCLARSHPPEGWLPPGATATGSGCSWPDPAVSRTMISDLAGLLGLETRSRDC